MNRFVTYILLAAPLMASCDAHQPYEDMSLQVGHVLCSDGSTMSCADAYATGLQPVAVVFYVNRDETVSNSGYAVWLDDLGELSLSDTLGIGQGTSADITALDGNANTYQMFVGKEACSPAADACFAMWSYGQSAFIPSVAEMRLLVDALYKVNPVIGDCGGTPLSFDADSCWYWTSTEVGGQQSHKAWLFSSNGVMQETPKDERHLLRPIVELNR